MPKHSLSENGGPAKKRRRSDEDSSQSANKRPSFSPVPSLLVKPWKAADIPSQLPPLPKIYDPDLETQAFRHPGIAGPSYERLEWLGDAYLETIATALIFQSFPTLSSGRCSQIREQLIRNVNLSGYFRQYGMETRANMPPDIALSSRNGRGRSADKDLVKVQGDMFEAYVAGIVVSDPVNGLKVAAEWLRMLFSMSIKDQIIQNERQAAMNENRTSTKNGDSPVPERTPKDKLIHLIGMKGISISYEAIPEHRKDERLGLPLFTMGVYLTGWGENHRLLGTGTALGKKEAGQNAAGAAIEKKELMEIYSRQKCAALVEQEKKLQAAASQ